MTWKADVLCDGSADAEALVLEQPISFWGGVNPVNSEVVLSGHPQHGQKIQGRVLVIPQLIGSSSSSAVMLELIYNDRAPAALLLGNRDAILPIGVLVAEQMGWQTIPVLQMSSLPFKTGDRLQITAGGSIGLSPT